MIKLSELNDMIETLKNTLSLLEDEAKEEVEGSSDAAFSWQQCSTVLAELNWAKTVRKIMKQNKLESVDMHNSAGKIL